MQNKVYDTSCQLFFNFLSFLVSILAVISLYVLYIIPKNSQLRITLGADVNSETSGGATPMYIAAQNLGIRVQGLALRV